MTPRRAESLKKAKRKKVFNEYESFQKKKRGEKFRSGNEIKEMFFLRIVFGALILFTSAAFCPAAPGQPNKRKIEWRFEIKDGENAPESKVYLIVGARRILILADATERYEVIERQDYERYDIPPVALTAVSGWWAGQGKTLYVARRRNRLLVYIKYADEAAPDFPFAKLKTIRMPPNFFPAKKRRQIGAAKKN